MRFNYKDIIHEEFVSRGKTVNIVFYSEVTQTLLTRIKRGQATVEPVRPDTSTRYCFGTTHIVLEVKSFSAQKNIVLINRPPYSSVLSFDDFFLFPKLKVKLKRRRFDSIQHIQKKIS